MNIGDNVQETTAGTSTSVVVVNGATANNRTFAAAVAAGAFSVGATNIPLKVEDDAGNWLTGAYTLTNVTTLTRTAIGASSAAGADVTLAGTVRKVSCTLTSLLARTFLSAADGTTLETYLAANPGSTPNGSDLIPVVEGVTLKGVSASQLAVFVNSTFPSAKVATVIIATTTPFPLDFSTHNRRELWCTAAATINAPGSYASVGDDFTCDITNVSGGVVTLGTGIVGLPNGTTIANGNSARVRAVAGVIYAKITSAVAVADTIAPTVSSAAVANATPTYVDIAMSETMDTAFMPAASAVTVSGHTVSALAWASSTVLRATVSVAFVNGEAARTVAYTQPGTNNARDLAGNLLANFAALAITNNVGVPAPGQVTGLTVGTMTNNSAPLSWTVVSGAASYKVNRRVTSVGGAWTSFATGVTGTSSTVTGLAASTGYDFQVVASNTTGDGTPSATVTGTTAGAAVAPFTATAHASFPLTLGAGASDYMWHNIAPTGTATIVSVDGALSTSNTILPTAALGQGTSPKGHYLGALTNYQAPGTQWLAIGLPLITYSEAPANYYYWLIVTDSNGAKWNFCHTAPISIGTGNGLTTTGTTSPSPQA